MHSTTESKPSTSPAPQAQAVGRTGIRDIAKLAGVSVATVSRVLNGSDLVKPESAARIRQVMQMHNYLPHAAARSLGRMKTETIGVVLPDIHGSFFSELMRGIDAVAHEAKLHVLIASAHGSLQEAQQLTQSMYGRVDGLLLMLPEVDDAQEATALSCGMPTVWINSPLVFGDQCVVSVDSYSASRSITQHLVDGQRRQIAFIAGPEKNADADQRLRAYHAVLAEQNPPLPAWVLRGDFSEESGYQAGQVLAASAHRLDAVFAANDLMAMGCLRALQEAKLQIPEQIALAGFDGNALTLYANPPITTVQVDVEGLGREAMAQLLQSLAVPLPNPISAAQRPQLLFRQSTRAAQREKGATRC